jgi:hypothetical protein
MKRTIAITIAVLALCLGGTEIAAHHGPDNILIDAAAKRQPGVPFNHGKHATKLVSSCDTCHHTQKGLTDATKTKVVKCTTCHLDPKGDVPGMREMSMQKNPFHTLCVDCHKTEKKGPVACAGCHVKK